MEISGGYDYEKVSSSDAGRYDVCSNGNRMRKFFSRYRAPAEAEETDAAADEAEAADTEDAAADEQKQQIPQIPIWHMYRIKELW